MPSERPSRRVQDMLDNIERLRRYVGGRSRDDFLGDEMAQDAVERCLERIAEAARKIGDAYDADFPQAQLASLRAFGSVLRHDYDRINPVLVWNYAMGRLDDLERALQSILDRVAD